MTDPLLSITGLTRRYGDHTVLEIVHPLDESGETRVERVIEEYKRRFNQEAVLRVVTVGRANF